MSKKKRSYGVIPLRRQRGRWEVLLVKHGKGHWAFPKGHPERGEEPRQTAVRELKEETGLKIQAFLEAPLQEERYFFHEGPDLIDKTVVYFIAEVAGEVCTQKEEIADFKWLSFKRAQKLATFPETKRLVENTFLTLISLEALPQKIAHPRK
jgi:bis(5'-nucleosidyl)-tetraphosphatase